MVKCSAVNCKSASYNKTPEITFHRFPKDEKLKDAWINNMKRKNWQPAPSSVLCSKHFEPHLIDNTGFRAVLTADAIPTIFDYPPESEENKENVTTSPLEVKRRKITYPTHNLQSLKNAPRDFTALSIPQEKNNQIPTVSFKAIKEFPMSTASHQDERNVIVLAIPEDPQGAPGPSKITADISKIRGTCSCAAARELTQLKSKLISKNKTIKALREKTRRLKKKVAKFSDIITELKGKLQDEDLSILKNIPGNNKDFLIRYIKKAQNLKLEKAYSPELRSFALQLNFYSPRCYKFVRQTFNTILPHPATISRWYKKVNAEPGFTTESLKILEEISKKSQHATYVNLSIDEMSIRKELVWDGSKFQGHVDTGTDVQDDSLPLATLALVMFVTAINGIWKIPIAFFFITSMSGEQRANFIRIAIQLLTEINIYVRGLTFDGAAANISMATHLGCSFDLNNLQPYFVLNSHKIHVFWDPCHMLKLIRNTFGDFKIMIDSQGLIINFEYINQLLLLQQNKGLHLGNKLRQAHVLYNKQKMKVRLAAQLLSKSVADAIHFARERLKLSEFKDSYATEQFINIINDCFDILNSRSLRPPGFKKALCEANIIRTIEFINCAVTYLKSLKFNNQQLIVTAARKTGFVGFIVSLTSALDMFKELVQKERLLFLPLYKVSQDHLEMFFGKIRARGGYNDNPNIVQFKLAYKKNVIMTELGINDSGLYTDHISILTTPSTSNVEKINCATPSYNCHSNHDPDNEESKLFIEQILNRSLDDFEYHVIIYIAGFIARKVIKNVKCCLCQLLVIGEKGDFLFSLINIKDRGGLTYPSEGIIKIIKRCEKYFKSNKIVTTGFITKYWEHNDYLNLFNPGSGDDEHDAEHVFLLTKVIINYYVNLRNKHLSKEKQNVSKRNLFKKIILFENK